ncbi:sigma factor, partial [Clostridium sp. D53t1_180928_C8]|uniref:sigma factor n=1 Tax=Clostridium sp. D53t1_180928_C8 TaxID=2787101 RepID=UPI002434B429
IEDDIQNTVVKAYEKINTLKKDEFFKTWLIRILINECNEIIRKNKRLETINNGSNEERYNDTYENIDLINAINEELRITTVLLVVYYDHSNEINVYSNNIFEFEVN